MWLIRRWALTLLVVVVVNHACCSLRDDENVSGGEGEASGRFGKEHERRLEEIVSLREKLILHRLHRIVEARWARFYNSDRFKEESAERFEAKPENWILPQGPLRRYSVSSVEGEDDLEEYSLPSRFQKYILKLSDTLAMLRDQDEVSVGAWDKSRVSARLLAADKAQDAIDAEEEERQSAQDYKMAVVMHTEHEVGDDGGEEADAEVQEMRNRALDRLLVQSRLEDSDNEGARVGPWDATQDQEDNTYSQSFDADIGDEEMGSTPSWRASLILENQVTFMEQQLSPDNDLEYGYVTLAPSPRDWNKGSIVDEEYKGIDFGAGMPWD